MTLSITIIIIIITCIISFAAFNSEKIFDDLIFYPPAITNDRQYYRFFTCGLIHANYMHLGFNMYSLYIFGPIVETEFLGAFGEKGKWLYLLMYISSLFFCLLPTYFKNRNNYNYRSLGASGWRSFRAVILPLSLPGVGTGCLLVFSLSMSAYAVPALIAGPQVKVMSELIYEQTMALLDWPFAGCMSIILLISTTGLYGVATRTARWWHDREVRRASGQAAEA